MKTPKVNKRAHTPNTQLGMGDSYGSAVKNKVGRIIDDSFVNPIKNKGKPPKSLA